MGDYYVLNTSARLRDRRRMYGNIDVGGKRILTSVRTPFTIEEIRSSFDQIFHLAQNGAIEVRNASNGNLVDLATLRPAQPVSAVAEKKAPPSAPVKVPPVAVPSPAELLELDDSDPEPEPPVADVVDIGAAAPEPEMPREDEPRRHRRGSRRTES